MTGNNGEEISVKYNKLMARIMCDKYSKFFYDFTNRNCMMCGTQFCDPHKSENLFGCTKFIGKLEEFKIGQNS